MKVEAVELLTPMTLRKIRGKGANRLWLNYEHFRFDVWADGRKETFEVPAGYVTDLGSVPRLPLVFVIAGDVAHDAALAHDWLYTNQVGWKYSDGVFFYALLEEGESRKMAWAMYSALRGLGWYSYLTTNKRRARVAAQYAAWQAATMQDSALV